MPDNDNTPRPPIQVLAVACTEIGGPDPHCAWLHGYALLTLQPTDDDVHLSGTVVTGERYVDDGVLTTALADALDPDAMLAGVDLTGMISRLGRLPIEVIDQGPSLALLGKLAAMLENHDPIDLTTSTDAQVALAAKVVEHKLLFRKERDDRGNGIRLQLFASIDNLNPNYLAAELADMVGAAALAIGDLYLEPAHGQPLLEGVAALAAEPSCPLAVPSDQHRAAADLLIDTTHTVNTAEGRHCAALGASGENQ